MMDQAKREALETSGWKGRGTMSGKPLTDDELKDLAQCQSECGPQPGQVFRHYKGGLYTIVARAIQEDDLTPLVIYRSNQQGTTWARTLQDFTEVVAYAANNPDGPGPRFRRVED